MDNSFSITVLLDKLADIYLLEKEENRDEILEAFKEYYAKHKRHKYAEIAQYVLDTLESDKESEKIDVVTDNLDVLCDYLRRNIPCVDNQNNLECKKVTGMDVCDDESGKYRELSELYNSLNKLNDHTHLESLRWSKILNDTGKQAEFISRIQEKQQELDAEHNKVNEELINTEKELKEKTQSVYMHIVSILGIFTAIVFGVFGGVKAVESVAVAFSAEGVGCWEILFAVSLIMLFVIWVIYLLFCCIKWLQEQSLKFKPINIIVGSITVICVCLAIFAAFKI